MDFSGFEFLFWLLGFAVGMSIGESNSKRCKKCAGKDES